MVTIPRHKKIFLLLLFFILHNMLSAQELSMQIAPGLINYGGDLQSTIYTFNEAELSINGALMYSINKWIIRGNATYGHIKGSDAANSLYPNRNLSFKTKITEISLCLEYDFFKLDNTKKFTPYVFAGVGLFHYNPYTYYDSERVYLRPLSTEGEGLSIYPDKKIYPLTPFEIPLGLGFKYKLSDHFQIGFEFCTRYLFTDYLDDVSNSYPDENTLLKERSQLAVDLSFRGDELNPSARFPSGESRGNPKLNDNFYTSAFSIIYVFQGQSPFSNNNSSGSKKKKTRSLDCPKVK